MATNRATDSAAHLRALVGAIAPATFALTEDVYTIGRAGNCQIVIPEDVFAEKMVSRLHAKIERSGPRYLLTDLGSANGTYVDGRRLHEPHLLTDSDRLGFGRADPLFVFVDPDPTYMPLARLNYDERMMLFTVGRRALDLTPKQFRLLHYLFRHAGVVCTRENCIREVWAEDADWQAAGNLDEHLSNIRAKLREQGLPDLIKTRRGAGYVLEL